MELSELQLEGSRWLSEESARYLADPPGFGKTRTFLHAVGEVPLLVVCPAAIRDADVWGGEIARVGWEGYADVISYHQLAKGYDPTGYEAVVFDEAHHLKNRKVSWGKPAVDLAKEIPTVYLGSGTPTPNNATELWGQMRLVRPEIRSSYWNWINAWFNVDANVYSAFDTSEGTLLACRLDDCHNAYKVKDECKHWEEFREANQIPWMLGRPEELQDLPPMSGQDTPLQTPMKPEQRKAYRQLKKEFLAELPDGAAWEAISDSQKFIQLWQLSTGVSSVGWDLDPDDRHSGKLALIAEMLDDRSSPTLLACYFRNSAAALVRVCERLGKSYATFGAATTPSARKKAISDFQDGKIDVMVGSIAVVGEGITLTAADGVWLTERMWTPDKNSQVIRRVRRRGQDKPVGVRQFVTPDSVDAGQWGALQDKTARIQRTDVARLLDGHYDG